MRQVPLPLDLLNELDRVFELRIAQRDPRLATLRLWRWSRTTGWRYVKAVMAIAGITGTPAMPRGLRHGFGVNAFQASVPPHLVQRWLGHASLRTTFIYGVMKPAGNEVLQRWPVSKRVNSSKAPTDDASLIDIDGGVATSDEIMAATTTHARELGQFGRDDATN